MHNLCQTRKNQNLKGKIHHESMKERKHQAKSIDIYIINKEYIPSHKLNLPSKNTAILGEEGIGDQMP